MGATPAPFKGIVSEEPYYSTYSVWLCPEKDVVPALHETLSSEMEGAASRLKAAKFDPHVTIAGWQEAEEENMKVKFFEMAESLKVRASVPVLIRRTSSVLVSPHPCTLTAHTIPKRHAKAAKMSDIVFMEN